MKAWDVCLLQEVLKIMKTSCCTNELPKCKLGVYVPHCRNKSWLMVKVCLGIKILKKKNV
jgi:hypothetical protein